jgi:hypothetical protein
MHSASLNTYRRLVEMLLAGGIKADLQFLKWCSDCLPQSAFITTTLKRLSDHSNETLYELDCMLERELLEM